MNASVGRSLRDPVSQRDIARHFGVSHVTVSLALRNSRRVSKSLTEEIRAYAESVGYRRDPVLLALASYRDRKSAGPVRGAIAWINAWRTPGDLRANPEIERFWRGAAAAAMEERLRLEEFRLGTELSAERLHQVLETRNIRGLILPPHVSTAAWRGFPWENYAIVRFGRGGDGPRGHHVMPSAPANMVQAIRKMREKGCRRIGCLTGASLLRTTGYCMEESLPAVKRDLGCGGELFLLDAAGFSEGEIAGEVGGWIRKHRLDAVLADEASRAEWLVNAGMDVPGDVTFAALATDRGAGIDLGSEEIGRTAFQMLDSLMRERENGVRGLLRQVAVEGTWRDGPGLPHLIGSQGITLGGEPER